MNFALCLGLFAPLVGFLILTLLSSRISRKAAGFIGCAAILTSFLCFAYLLVHYNLSNMAAHQLTLFTWIHIGKINADFTLNVDALSLLMTLIITGVGFLIHVYSNGYMDHDKDYARYFACMNFFVFSMLLLVLAANLLLLFVGWEGVGLASYLLIGFWYDRPAAAQAATKAFVVNRIGDLGLLLGLLLTFHLFGTSDFAEVSRLAKQNFAVGAPLMTLLTALYFVGATGKSAQLPLHTWLPDAMEGPTPVSALIHAATMVTAGVYLVVRMHEVFELAPATLWTVGAVGGVTSLFASLCAVGQTDLKRVLAYSTVSQLGLMFLACGAGAYYAAMFHLTTHAFIKALLFLSAGIVIHLMHGYTEMDKMGALSKKFPVTNWLFLIGVLALSGIPPLAAFFSKDLILEEEFMVGLYDLYIIAVAASILTGFYLMRTYSIAFMGKPRWDESFAKEEIKEPPIMTLPVSVLALLAIGGGLLGFAVHTTPILEKFLSYVGVDLAMPVSNLFFLSHESLAVLALVILGVVSSAILYTRYADRLGKTWTFLTKAFYLNEIYDALFVKPLKALARAIAYYFEPVVFENSIQAAAHGAGGTARLLQKFQSGQIRSYAAWMVIGIVLLIALIVF